MRCIHCSNVWGVFLLKTHTVQSSSDWIDHKSPAQTKTQEHWRSSRTLKGELRCFILSFQLPQRDLLYQPWDSAHTTLQTNDLWIFFMLTDIPNERGKFHSRKLMQSLTKELWHFNFILGFIHVLNSEGIKKIHKKIKSCFSAWACTGTKVFNTKLK